MAQKHPRHHNPSVHVREHTDSDVPPAPAIAPGSVVLKVPRVDALHCEWPAGSVIAPNVEGWPAHRVQHVLNNGYAEAAE